MEIKEMVGKIFTSVKAEYDELIFENEEEKVTFYHDQDCCENVSIEEIHGELSDLEGEPLWVAEVITNDDSDSGWDEEWTFYVFRTNKGTVTVRWFGASNGYYSTSVSMSHEIK